MLWEPCSATIVTLRADAVRYRAIQPATLGGGTARCRTGRRVRRPLETRCHRTAAQLPGYGASDPEGWVSTRIAPVRYLPVSGCCGECRSVCREPCPLAVDSRKSQVGGPLGVHGWMYPAYMIDSPPPRSLTWGFPLNCARFVPAGFHHCSTVQSRLCLRRSARRRVRMAFRTFPCGPVS